MLCAEVDYSLVCGDGAKEPRARDAIGALSCAWEVWSEDAEPFWNSSACGFVVDCRLLAHSASLDGFVKSDILSAGLDNAAPMRKYTVEIWGRVPEVDGGWREGGRQSGSEVRPESVGFGSLSTLPPLPKEMGALIECHHLELYDGSATTKAVPSSDVQVIHPASISLSLHPQDSPFPHIDYFGFATASVTAIKFNGCILALNLSHKLNPGCIPPFQSGYLSTQAADHPIHKIKTVQSPTVQFQLTYPQRSNSTGVQARLVDHGAILATGVEEQYYLPPVSKNTKEQRGYGRRVGIIRNLRVSKTSKAPVPLVYGTGTVGIFQNGAVAGPD
ncbi:hypothetical protein DFP72DRAFT_861315 [Ephemerocybe angulata]|uniref:Uncharacterized protein n=1 Tax=Ephemerocybe angulata TaxID=980116 RepID=A0A8H6H9R5_9AGAR|nr:hypothetical protein DFP72DRAFT_861315 [Tulosesus angulatus]